MEHKIYNSLRKLKIPLFLRIILTFCLIIVGLAFVIFPFPGSAIVGWGLIVFSFIFVVKAKKLIYLAKIRKGIFYLLKNIHDKRITKYKMYNIKRHIKDILDSKK